MDDHQPVPVTRRGKGGRPSLGPRKNIAVRVPLDKFARIEEARQGTGLTENDFAAACIMAAIEAGLAPEPVPEEQLQMTA